jgi:hemerythrin-like domain-containing protein
MKEKNSIDVNFLGVAVDFFRTYADRTHHGKEEDILFRELAGKLLSPKDARAMNDLIQEHVRARTMVTRLFEAKESYSSGNLEVRADLFSLITELTRFYPAHIIKEDKDFFYPCLEYFSKQEQDEMLEEFWEFDKKLIHEKYQKIVEEAELKNL